MFAILIPIFAMMIPIVAIAGGITVAVFQTIGQRKIAELAMRERIAAIERGLDPAKLPPLPDHGLHRDARTPRERALATAQGFYVAALITFASGLGVSVLLFFIEATRERPLWPIGLVPMFVALGLGAAGALVRRDAPPAGALRGE